jgi:hypothetical protein
MNKSEHESIMTERYESILERATRLVAHPHHAITPHDKHRAIALIIFLSSDEELCEYIYSQMTQDDFKSVKQIRESIK